MSNIGLQSTWFESDLPDGWKLSPTRAAFFEKTLRSGKALDNYLSLTASAGVIPYAEKGDVGNKAPEDMSKCKRVERGDFVLNSMNFGIGSFGVSPYEGVCSSVYLVLKPNTDQFNPLYLRRIFELSEFQKHAQSFGNGILAHRAAFGWDKLRKTFIPKPPRSTQDQIVAFLDQELEKQDELWGKLSELLGSLNELRVSIVDKMLSELSSKDITKIKYACKLNQTSKRGATELVDFFPMEAIEEWNGLNFGNVIDATDASSGYSHIRDGDVIIAKVTPCFENRKGTVVSGLSSEFGLATTEVFVLSPSKEFDPNFIRLVLSSSRFIKEGERSMTGAGGLKRVSSTFLSNFTIPKIAIEDQKAIVKKVERKMETLNKLEALLIRANDLIKLRRESVISAAVTGKRSLGGI